MDSELLSEFDQVAFAAAVVTSSDPWSIAFAVFGDAGSALVFLNILYTPLNTK